MNDLISPVQILSEVAKAIPAECHQHVIIIGSLAAGYHFFRNDEGQTLRTKDVDCMFAPSAKAVVMARGVAEQLFDAKWTYRESTDWPAPGKPEQPLEQLPLVRLNPPGNDEWFIELLGAPEERPDATRGRNLVRLETRYGHFTLCSFGYLGLVEHKPLITEFGIYIASPEMMALANLLHHPRIGAEVMSGDQFGGGIKRSNKDLGRVLALAYLTTAQELETWPEKWAEALEARYPMEAPELAVRAGTGLRELLASPDDLHQAHITCSRGLLASIDVRLEALQATGERLMADVIEPLEEKARQSAERPRPKTAG